MTGRLHLEKHDPWTRGLIKPVTVLHSHTDQDTSETTAELIAHDGSYWEGSNSGPTNSQHIRQDLIYDLGYGRVVLELTTMPT